MADIRNRSAYHDYFIDDKYDAGMVLTGTEVKSLRDGRASFNDSYCFFNKGELFIRSLHIAEYSHGTVNNHDPVRERKLLLKKLQKLQRKKLIRRHKRLLTKPMCAVRKYLMTLK